MTAQTSYSINQGKAYPGGLYGLGNDDIISRDAEGEIAFGLVVSRGTDADRQAIPGGIADVNVLGISIRSLEREGVQGSNLVSYKDTETVGILQEGYIWAVCPTGCVPGDPVNFVNATGVLDSGAAVVGETSLDEAQWDTTAAAGELGVIRLNGLATTAGS